MPTTYADLTALNAACPMELTDNSGVAGPAGNPADLQAIIDAIAVLAVAGGNTSAVTDNGDGTYEHDDGLGNTTTIQGGFTDIVPNGANLDITYPDGTMANIAVLQSLSISDGATTTPLVNGDVITFTDTGTIDLTVSGSSVTANVDISNDGGNTISIGTDAGLYSSNSQPTWIADQNAGVLIPEAIAPGIFSPFTFTASVDTDSMMDVGGQGVTVPLDGVYLISWSLSGSTNLPTAYYFSTLASVAFGIFVNATRTAQNVIKADVGDPPSQTNHHGTSITATVLLTAGDNITFEHSAHAQIGLVDMLHASVRRLGDL